MEGSLKWSKITKFCNFALSGIGKTSQNLFLQFYRFLGKPKMVKNREIL